MSWGQESTKRSCKESAVTLIARDKGRGNEAGRKEGRRLQKLTREKRTISSRIGGQPHLYMGDSNGGNWRMSAGPLDNPGKVGETKP